MADRRFDGGAAIEWPDCDPQVVLDLIREHLRTKHHMTDYEKKYGGYNPALSALASTWESLSPQGKTLLEGHSHDDLISYNPGFTLVAKTWGMLSVQEKHFVEEYVEYLRTNSLSDDCYDRNEQNVRDSTPTNLSDEMLIISRAYKTWNELSVDDRRKVLQYFKTMRKRHQRDILEKAKKEARRKMHQFQLIF